MIQSDFRYAHHPNDVKKYTTEELRQHFLIPTLFVKDEINLTYTMYDRFIAGGALPVDKPLQLNAIDELKANYFLERRELGIINVGGKGKVIVDGKAYEIGHKEALYVGRGHKDIYFEATEGEQPYFYLNSAPAHKAYPAKKVTLADAEVVELGDSRNCNERKINKLIVNSVVQTCQLQMGMTELKEGSIWNTMPPHTHARRMEVYFYFNLEDGQTVSHFMGQPQETRHVFMKNHQAIISPEWSIHSGAGTSNYTFIWGMAGENLDYTDMDGVQPHELR
jgi:4-deoxy-L-threo-5-hexosulose-uronate ketol-isomerase